MTDEHSLLQLLERIYFDVCDLRRDLRANDRLSEDLGMDSLAAAELLTALEEELDISIIDDTRITSVRTVADVLVIIRDHRGA